MLLLTNIGVIIPCYNEERRLLADNFINELAKNPNLSLLFVNDGSTDDTLKVIQKICEADPARALCLSSNENKGKGEAIRMGMLYLLEKKTYDIIGFWDADLAVPLAEIWDFMDIFQTNQDVQAVIGSRVHLAGRKIERVNFRHYIGRLFATVMSLTFGFDIYDTQCGAKLFKSKILIPVVQKPFSSRWIFDVELIIRILRLPFLQNKSDWLFEVAVKEWKDVSGTKRSISAYINSFFDYITLVRKYLF
ncbi:glycosyltransferase [Candidatus Desantisbacteria bacterium]|nr:glycosyltransferase [Candidatus Desantisbacteria bacterium]